MKKPPNGPTEGFVFALDGSYRRPISQAVAEIDSLLGGQLSADADLAPQSLDHDAVWKAHNARSAPKGIR